jgi:hypothetical protein
LHAKTEEGIKEGYQSEKANTSTGSSGGTTTRGSTVGVWTLGAADDDGTGLHDYTFIHHGHSHGYHV